MNIFLIAADLFPFISFKSRCITRAGRKTGPAPGGIDDSKQEIVT
jgi:hypothetical protein